LFPGWPSNNLYGSLDRLRMYLFLIPEFLCNLACLFIGYDRIWDGAAKSITLWCFYEFRKTED
ncbi:MAG: hypothetical protein WCH85_11260, partial [Methanomicrobiales archaeon]